MSTKRYICNACKKTIQRINHPRKCPSCKHEDYMDINENFIFAFREIPEMGHFGTMQEKRCRLANRSISDCNPPTLDNQCCGICFETLT